MFPTQVYTKRRKALKSKISKGVGFFPGNVDVPFNYSANIYRFRQDSSFLYFFGIDKPGLSALIDFESGDEILFGNEITHDDIIWMGAQPALADTAQKVGIQDVRPLYKLDELVKEYLAEGRQVHYLPPYRGETKISMNKLLGVAVDDLESNASEALIKAVVDLRSVKDDYEIKEIEKAVDVAYKMHTTAMQMALEGTKEQQIAGVIEGIALSNGGPVAFPVILSKNGQILHNHDHSNILKRGDLMVVDAGAELESNYTSDITRTTPVGGKFSQRQKEIYEIVLEANMQVIEKSKPGILYKDMHLLAANIIASGLTDLGIMKGNPEEAVRQGAHALFMPHGLGHMMGLDVHDLEGVSEEYAGYGDELKRSKQFGLSALRLAKELKPGYVLTDEPGIYFIPELVKLWKSENRFTDFIDYKKVEDYLDFGGIRIEDDLLITDTGNRVLGKPIPKTVKEIEEIAGTQA
jgi:Xaa-Pro aminopeptidase